MTPQEVLKDIETTEYRLSKGYIKLGSFYLDNFNKVVKSALEKQIPKKPITKNELIKTERGYELLDENEQEYCPVCNFFVQPPCEKYCTHCGQALDWSDTE